MKKENLGSNFDDFLREEGLLEDAEATAAKRVIAFQDCPRDETLQAFRIGDGQPDPSNRP